MNFTNGHRVHFLKHTCVTACRNKLLLYMIRLKWYNTSIWLNVQPYICEMLFDHIMPVWKVQRYLVELVTCLCQLAEDVVKDSHKEKGFMCDFNEACMVNMYIYKAEGLDIILQLSSTSCIGAKEKLIRAHSLLVLALQADKRREKVTSLC